MPTFVMLESPSRSPRRQRTSSSSASSSASASSSSSPSFGTQWAVALAMDAGAAPTTAAAPPPALGPVTNVRWDAHSCLPRLLSVILADMRGFLKRNEGLTCREKDNGETKSFWHKAAVTFNNTKFVTVLYGIGREIPLMIAYSGYHATAEGLEKKFNEMRTYMDKAIANFTRSRNGDGGPVSYNLATSSMCTSDFWEFCNGNSFLYYFWKVLNMFDLTKSATSRMPLEIINSSDVALRRTVTSASRASSSSCSASSSSLPTHDTIEIQRTRTAAQEQLDQARAAAAAAMSVTARDETMKRLIEEYELAKAAMEAHKVKDTESLVYRAKKARFEAIEVELTKMME
mmetsp:Transcript_10598/g.24684  ORF Transcript_10598/g.24684 Transcript_10598/m.24684 type:complete len:345 (-) Transcript_10598:71-1105(-)